MVCTITELRDKARPKRGQPSELTHLHATWYCRRHATMAAVTPSGGSFSWLKLLSLLLSRLLSGSLAAALLLPNVLLLLPSNWMRSPARLGKLSRACAPARNIKEDGHAGPSLCWGFWRFNCSGHTCGHSGSMQHAACAKRAYMLCMGC
jgi:hypothetical protein